jgi:hypothetical protein
MKSVNLKAWPLEELTPSLGGGRGKLLGPVAVEEEKALKGMVPNCTVPPKVLPTGPPATSGLVMFNVVDG